MAIIPDRKSLLKDSFDKRLSLLTEALRKCQTNYNNSAHLSPERNLHAVLKIFLDKSSPSVMYTLKEIIFSSQWELFNPKKIGLASKVEISRTLNNLEKYGIVSRLSKKSDDYKIIKVFWKKEHPTSPIFPQMFVISEAFKPVVEAYSKHFRRTYMWKTTLSEIKKRKDRYEAFYKSEGEHIKLISEIERNKTGNCHQCGLIIKGEAKLGKDYHSFPIGLICHQCKIRLWREKGTEWMQATRS